MKRSSAQITIIYLLVGITWIWVSDAISTPEIFADPATFQSVKGIGYVIVTGLLMFVYLRKNEDDNIEAAERSVEANLKHSAQLEENNARITDMLESVNDGFIALDENWTITYWNKEAERILSIPRESVVGHNFWVRFPNMSSFKFRNYYLKAAEDQKSYRFKEYFETRNMWLEFTVCPSEKGLSIFFHDITQIKFLNKERKKRMAELATTNAELEQFAYIASHDLQEPLRMVTGFLTQLEKKYKDQLDEKAQQYIFFAVDGAVRMRRIILDLLAYSRIGKDAFERELIKVDELIEEIKRLDSTLFDEQNVVLSVNQLPEIFAARTMMLQLFQNLIINAIRYKRENVSPVIAVDAVESDDKWQFSVSDNGIGIDGEFAHKIFIPFQRLHNQETYSGNGIGLSICKKIVEAHGGTIWFESEPNVGSTFYFTINK